MISKKIVYGGLLIGGGVWGGNRGFGCIWGVLGVFVGGGSPSVARAGGSSVAMSPGVARQPQAGAGGGAPSLRKGLGMVAQGVTLEQELKLCEGLPAWLNWAEPKD